jgi:hypothetical protein
VGKESNIRTLSVSLSFSLSAKSKCGCSQVGCICIVVLPSVFPFFVSQISCYALPFSCCFLSFNLQSPALSYI